MRYSEQFVSQFSDAVARRAFSFSCRLNNTAMQLVELLRSQGYVSGYQVRGSSSTEREVFLTLSPALGKPRAACVKRLSTPGRYIYASRHCLPAHSQPGRRIVVSTSSAGFLSGEEACRKRLGGTLLFAVV